MSFVNVWKEIFYKLRNKKVKPEIISLEKKAPKELRKSLKLRCIDAWSDEWILAELYSLEWPYYSLESYNISFTASPKHADGLFIVWGISENMKKAVKQAWDLVPNPKVLIACWDDAINWSNSFWEKLYSVEEVLWKVDLKIPWNLSSKDIFNYLVNFIK